MEEENIEIMQEKSDQDGTCNIVTQDDIQNENIVAKIEEIPPQAEEESITSNLNNAIIEKFAANLMSELIADALVTSCKITWSIPCSQTCHMPESLSEENLNHWSELRLCWTPEPLQCSSDRRSSRSSLSSILSSSHSSLFTNDTDDSSSLSSSSSHEFLSSEELSDIYNVPLDSDNYAVPIDVKTESLKPPSKLSRRYFRERHFRPIEVTERSTKGRRISSHNRVHFSNYVAANNFRVPIAYKKPRPACTTIEPIHLTLRQVRQCIHNLYGGITCTSENKNLQGAFIHFKNAFKSYQDNDNVGVDQQNNMNISPSHNNNNTVKKDRSNKSKRNVFSGFLKRKKSKGNNENSNEGADKVETHKKSSSRRSGFASNLKQTLCNFFRFKKLSAPIRCLGKRQSASRRDGVGTRLSGHGDKNFSSPKASLFKRALPPLPQFEENIEEIIPTESSTPMSSPEIAPPLPPRVKRNSDEDSCIDYVSSIEKVKDYGWYWGPISGEAAEKILSNEPDGSFIVRDSSDKFYIFSLTFKLNSVVRHVRIDHDRGKFSFGSSHRFKSDTIVDFIESAVEHSRSGRYLFFLHRRPILGPMRVQLLHPVSRFKQVESLQHLCRFVILKYVRRDLINDLPLPKSVLDYLNKQHYYSEQLNEDEDSDSSFQELNHFLNLNDRKFS